MMLETAKKLISEYIEDADNSNEVIWRYPEYKSNKKKECDVMDLANVKVMVGNKTYTPNDIDFIQTPYAYPKLRLDVTLDSNIKPTIKSTNISIKNVIFNPPATIVFWSDNTKTVVKCDYELEPYDPEKGLAMAISKKMLGDNKYEYYNTFLHWLKKYNKQTAVRSVGEWDGDMSSI